MAGRWSTENYATEFKDLQASAMAVDCLGTWALLAGRKNLAFVDLNRPQTVVKVTRQSKWDIGCVQWNRHASHVYRFVTACNQRLDVFDFRDGSASHLCSLKAHSRTVSDIDWSPFDVNIVASCSVDTFTYFWDIRDAKKPVKSFQTVSGAAQVKWNRVTNNLFATSHDGDVRIWDPRKGNTPVQYLSAHPSKIHGLDWSEISQYNLVTASQDCTIRFWDYNNPRRSDVIINSGHPVWRARYTPFGEGVVSVIVPPLRRGENSLHLWHMRDQQSPVHTFVGHKDVVLEFQWRKQQMGVRDHQLITWSKDQSLRMWKVDRAMQKLCGQEVEELTDGILEEDNFLLPGDPLLTDAYLPASEPVSSNHYSQSSASLKRGVAGSGVGIVNGVTSSSQAGQQSPTMYSVVSLEQEIKEITGMIPGVRLEQADPARRTCTLKLTKGQHFVEMELMFPDQYPVRLPPSMMITHSNLDVELQARVLKIFSETCSKLVKQHTNCMEACIRQALLLMDKTGPLASSQESHHEDRKSLLDKKFVVVKVRTPTTPAPQDTVIPIYPMGGFQDMYIPFPKTCGASFCSNDRLVVFGVPVALKKVHEDNEITPRSLSDLFSYTMSQSHTQWMRSQPNYLTSVIYGSPPSSVTEGISVSNFYTEKTNRNRHHRNSHHHHQKTLSRSRDHVDGRRDRDKDSDKLNKRMQKVGSIKVYDVSNLNPVSRFLAENYKLDLRDITGMCDHNTSVAIKFGRKDLVQVWQLIKQMSHPLLKPVPDPDQGPPWAFCPFGRALVTKLLNHYSRMHDVQTMAMVCCLFWDKDFQTQDILLSALALPRSDSRSSFENTITSYNPYHTVSSMTSLLKGWTSTVIKNKRSQSWSEAYDDFNIIEEKDGKERELEKDRLVHLNHSRMLDPEQRPQHEQIKKAYAEILFKWGLLNERTQVLKYTDSKEIDKFTIELPVSCYHCAQEVRAVQCHKCKYPALICSICHIGVRGSASICLACGHGGHMTHMRDWFQAQTVCPTGCGCHCLQENTIRPESV